MEKKLDAIAEAQTVFVNNMPNRNECSIVLQQLVRSAEVANAIAPSAWSVTLLRNGFRLNVGQVEVLVFRAGIARVNIAGDVGTSPFSGEGFFEANYHSLSKSHCAFEGDALQLERVLSSIQPAHDQFIQLAAMTVTGKTRKGTPFRRSHSEGLMLYARNFLASDTSAVNGFAEWTPQEEQVSNSVFVEGARLAVQVNVFERSTQARNQCLSHYGMRCAVCDFSFEAVYGPVASSYIHVHHLKALASIGKEYVVDPIVDLRPVCANCHAVIHLRVPHYDIDEVKAMLHRKKGSTQP